MRLLVDFIDSAFDILRVLRGSTLYITCLGIGTLDFYGFFLLLWWGWELAGNDRQSLLILVFLLLLFFQLYPNGLCIWSFIGAQFQFR